MHQQTMNRITNLEVNIVKMSEKVTIMDQNILNMNKILSIQQKIFNKLRAAKIQCVQNKSNDKIIHHFNRQKHQNVIHWDDAESVQDLVNMVESVELIEFAEKPYLVSIRCRMCYSIKKTEIRDRLNNKYGKQIHKDELQSKSVLKMVINWLKRHFETPTHVFYEKECKDKMLRVEKCGEKICRLAWFVIINNLGEALFEDLIGLLSIYLDMGDWRHGRQQTSNYLDIFFGLHRHSVINIIKSTGHLENYIFIDLCLDKVSKKKISSEILLLGKIINGERKEIVLDLVQREYAGDTDVIGQQHVAQFIKDVFDNYDIKLEEIVHGTLDKKEIVIERND